MTTEGEGEKLSEVTNKGAQSKPPSVLKSPNEKKRQQSPSNTTSSSTATKSVRFERDKNNPAKIKAGKANIVRDLSIFVGIISLFFIFSLTTVSNVGVVDEEDLKKGKSRGKGMRDAYEVMFEAMRKEQEAAERKYADGKCEVLIAESSVPGGGMGLFSTQKFEKGDTVISRSMLVPFPSSVGNSESKSQLPQHTYLIKPHPKMANVESALIEDGGNSFATFTASRDIKPGDELFLDFDDLPKDFPFDTSTPEEKSYQTADAIVANLMDTARLKAIAEEKQKKKGIAGPGRGKGRNKISKPKTSDKDPKEGLGNALKLVKVATSTIDSKVGSLLPTTTQSLDLSSTIGSAQISLTNRTLAWLSKNGKCIHDKNIAQVKPATTINSENGIFAARFIAKGEFILPIPLYSYDEKQAPENHPLCFQHPSSSLVFCSLTFGSFVSHRETTSTCNDDEEDKAECTISPNAEYQWSSWNPWNEKLMDTSPKEIIGMRAPSLSLDLIATRDIPKGEEISMDYGVEWEKNAFRQPIKLSDELLPAAWKTR